MLGPRCGCRLSTLQLHSRLRYDPSLPNRRPPTDRLFHSTSYSFQIASPIKSSILSLHVDTAPPSAVEVAAAERFFTIHQPLKSWTATEWRQQPYSESSLLTPEVVFLGRSNAGKSSLLNALLMNPSLCRVGARPGKTTIMHAWALSPADPNTRGLRKGHQGDIEPKLTVLDMPGYGHGSRGDWGTGIMKYLTKRRQLRRAFVLVNPVHGLKTSDLQMLELLRGNGISHQLIASKCDHPDANKILPKLLSNIQAQLGKHLAEEQARGAPALLTISDIVAVGGLGDGKSNQKLKMKAMHGLGDLRWAVLRAAGLEEYALSLSTVEAKLRMQQTNDLPKIHSDADTDIPTQETPRLTEAAPVATRPAASTQSTSIGIGIDELVSMTRRPEVTHSRHKRVSNGRQRDAMSPSTRRPSSASSTMKERRSVGATKGRRRL